MKRGHFAVLGIIGLIALGIVFYATRLGDDDEIRERIVATLSRHPRINAPGLEVSFEGGIVTITGHVPDEATRKLVIDEVERIDHVECVVEEIIIDVALASEPPPNANKGE